MSSLSVMAAEYGKVVWRRKWLALAMLAAVIGGVATYTYRAIPQFESAVSMLIDQSEPNVVSFEKVVDARGGSVPTEQEILLSRMLVQKTVRALKVTERPEFGLPTEESAINVLKGSLQVVPVRGTRVVRVVTRWTDPVLAAEIANVHADQYVAQSYERNANANKDATDQIKLQLEDVRKKMNEADRAVQAYRERNDAMSLAEGQNIIVANLNSQNEAVERAKRARLAAETRFREIEAVKKDRAQLEADPTILADTLIQSIKTEVSRLSREELTQSQEFGANHPTLKATRQSLADAQSQLTAAINRKVTSVKTEYELLKAEEDGLKRELEDKKAEALTLNRRGAEYGALEREAQIHQATYRELQTRMQQTGISQDIRATNVTILDRARPIPTPVWPRTRFNLMMSVITGSLMALGLVFLVEMLDDRIKTATDMAEMVGQRLLVTVPSVRVAKGQRISIADPESPSDTREAFRALRTSVVSSDVLTEPRSLLVTSASEGEGKTHVACNLAIALAQAHYRVLLVDADMRRPGVHSHFGESLEPGLSNVLSGASSLRDALRSTSVSGLTVLTGGTASTHAPELLGSLVFGELFEVLQEHFDWVVLDSPPALRIADARVVAQRTKGFVFVASAKKTRARGAKHALDELQRTGAALIGTVLNRADREEESTYLTREYPSSVHPAGRQSSAAASRTRL